MCQCSILNTRLKVVHGWISKIGFQESVLELLLSSSRPALEHDPSWWCPGKEKVIWWIRARLARHWHVKTLGTVTGVCPIC